MGTVFAALFAFFSWFGTGVDTKLGDDVMMWGSPVTLSSSDASAPLVVMDSSGNATAIWVQSGAICTSSQPVGGSWGSVTTLGSSSSSDPQLAVDSSGNVTAGWIQSGVVMTAVLPFGSSWGSASSVSSATATSLTIAVDSGGRAVFAWARSGFVEAATKTTLLGSFGLVSTLSGSSAANPTLNINASGNICAVWEATVSGSNVIQAATQTLGGSWSSATTISPSSSLSFGFPQVAVNASGNPTAIFYEYGVTNGVYNSVALYAVSATSGTWNTAVPLLNDGQLGVVNPANLTANVQFDSSGNTIALWSQSYDGQSFSIEGAAYPSGGPNWEVGASLITMSLFYEADMAVNSLSEAITAYMYFDGTYATIQTSETGTNGLFNGGPTWSSPIEISTSATNNGYPVIATSYNNSGTGTMYAVALWLNSSGGNIYVQAATGSKTPIQPPTSLSVVQSSNNFGVTTEYYNTLSWTASVSPETNQYAVYRNGVLYTVVDGGITQVIDQNAVNGGTPTYGVSSLDNGFLGSVIAQVTLNND